MKEKLIVRLSKAFLLWDSSFLPEYESLISFTYHQGCWEYKTRRYINMCLENSKQMKSSQFPYSGFPEFSAPCTDFSLVTVPLMFSSWWIRTTFYYLNNFLNDIEITKWLSSTDINKTENSSYSHSNITQFLPYLINSFTPISPVSFISNNIVLPQEFLILTRSNDFLSTLF
jgi:hypothetical protein